MSTFQGPGPALTLPVKPLRLMKVFVAQALCRIPVYAITIGGILLLAGVGLGRVLGDSGIAGVGWWPVTIGFTALGSVLGSLAGFFSAIESALHAAEEDLRDWLGRLPESEGGRIVPTMNLAQLEDGYDKAVASLYDKMLGSLPLPAVVRRGVEAKVRHVLVDDFLESCRARGATTVGFAEVRDFALEKAIPLATRPAHAQLRIALLLVLGVAAPLLVVLLAGKADPGTTIAGAAAALGLAILVLARRVRRRINFRSGVGAAS
jgi:hypothetical protein